MERPRGDITTLLDLTDRDDQDDYFFPIKPEVSWFTRNAARRYTPFVPCVQEFPYRGPATFGQRISFDLTVQGSGDIVFGAVIQIKLAHWLNLTAQLEVQNQTYEYVDPQTVWFYCNSIGTALIQKAELEIGGVTIEEFDGDFSTVFSSLFPDLNSQVSTGLDAYGRVSMERLLQMPPRKVYPTEDGYIHCILPFYFLRSRIREYLPLAACREGTVRIHIIFRPFSEVVRQARGYRDSCESVPLNTTIQFYDKNFPYQQITSVTTGPAEPMFETVRLITYGAVLDGSVRNAMIRQPFEIMHREVQTFFFTEPLKYVIVKTTPENTIRIQLPLEANHPLEEILWFIRRKGTANNNEWTNYSSVLEREYDAVYNPRRSLLTHAKIQANGIDVIDAEEQYFRQQIGFAHRGGIVGYNTFVYGYSFARRPGDIHQPSGTLNASRLQSLRLVLDVRPPGGQFDQAWEVKVFCLGINWLRFQDGIANKMFTD
jgi:hypothetical protein